MLTYLLSTGAVTVNTLTSGQREKETHTHTQKQTERNIKTNGAPSSLPKREQINSRNLIH